MYINYFVKLCSVKMCDPYTYMAAQNASKCYQRSSQMLDSSFYVLSCLSNNNIRLHRAFWPITERDLPLPWNHTHIPCLAQKDEVVSPLLTHNASFEYPSSELTLGSTFPNTRQVGTHVSILCIEEWWWHNSSLFYLWVGVVTLLQRNRCPRVLILSQNASQNFKKFDNWGN